MRHLADTIEIIEQIKIGLEDPEDACILSTSCFYFVDPRLQLCKSLQQMKLDFINYFKALSGADQNTQRFKFFMGIKRFKEPLWWKDEYHDYDQHMNPKFITIWHADCNFRIKIIDKCTNIGVNCSHLVLKYAGPITQTCRPNELSSYIGIFNKFNKPSFTIKQEMEKYKQTTSEHTYKTRLHFAWYMFMFFNLPTHFKKKVINNIKHEITDCARLWNVKHGHEFAEPFIWLFPFTLALETSFGLTLQNLIFRCIKDIWSQYIKIQYHATLKKKFDSESKQLALWVIP